MVVGGTQAGNLAAYVFEKNAAGLWLLTGQAIGGPVSSNPTDIGPQVDTAANRIIIGNPYALIPSPTGVRIFEKQGTEWRLLENIPLAAGTTQGPDGTIVSLDSGNGGMVAFNSGQITGLVNTFDEEQPKDWWSIGYVRAIDAF